jgi:uncharacterized protein with GYD domain
MSVPKYLYQASYTTEGLRGLIKDGGTKRRAVAQKGVASVGGRLEAYYFAFGENDVIGIVDAPDNVSVAALSLAVSAAGAFNLKTTVLLTPEEMDQATKKTVTYTAPGQ